MILPGYEKRGFYFRIVVLNNTSLTKFLRVLLPFIALAASPLTSIGQGCDEAMSNVLCSENPAQDTTSATPFSYGCMNVQQSVFYSFQTNSVASSNSLTITVNNRDCSDFLGADSLYIMVVRIPDGADACDPANYSNPICLGDSGNTFSLQLNNLLDSQDYLLIVGSNHDTAYGSCPFDVSISGDALALVAGVNPIRVSLGDPAQLTVEGQDEGSDISWTPAEFLDDPAIPNPIAYPEETTTFTVTGQIGGCEVTDMITITVAPPIEIFNTFTPNGDGINDTWRIKQIERFPNCQVEVFDRWGQSIFKSIGYAQPWDGTNKGKRLPMAAYYYVIQLNSLNVTIAPITGVVSIVH